MGSGIILLHCGIQANAGPRQFRRTLTRFPMAIYAIGDVQGSFEELRALLGAIAFDGARDRLQRALDSLKLAMPEK